MPVSNFYDTLVQRTAINMGVPADTARLIAAQARHETANYTSRVFQANKNFFGYKFVGQAIARPGTKAPANEGAAPYAAYDTFEDSVKELVNWLRRRQNEGKFRIQDLTTAERYNAALQSGGFYTDRAGNYLRGLQSALSKIAPYAAGGAGLLLLGIIFFVAYKK